MLGGELSRYQFNAIHNANTTYVKIDCLATGRQNCNCDYTLILEKNHDFDIDLKNCYSTSTRNGIAYVQV